MKQRLMECVTVQLAGIVEASVVDGPGLRMSIFFQGCQRRCEFCHNKHTWDPNAGYPEKLDDLVERIEALPKWYSGITLTGGEPFNQESQAVILAQVAKNRGFSVWTYTGHTLDQLLFETNHPLLYFTDYLVDGAYDHSLKSPETPWIGSKNQRILDLTKVVWYNKPTIGGIEDE